MPAERVPVVLAGSDVIDVVAENERLRGALIDAIGAVAMGRVRYSPLATYQARIGVATVNRWRRVVGERDANGRVAVCPRCDVRVTPGATGDICPSNKPDCAFERATNQEHRRSS